MNDTDTPFQKYIGGWLGTVSKKVSHSFAQRLDGSGVTLAEWIVLRMIYDCGATVSPSEVSRRTGLSRGAVSKLVDRSIRKGLVTREESKEDRRYQELALTVGAKRLVPKLMHLAQDTDDEFFSCLTKSERKTLERILKKIVVCNEITELPTV